MLLHVQFFALIIADKPSNRTLLQLRKRAQFLSTLLAVTGMQTGRAAAGCQLGRGAWGRRLLLGGTELGGSVGKYDQANKFDVVVDQTIG